MFLYLYICIIFAFRFDLSLIGSFLNWTVLSETSGTVRKSGSNFKEKLRELGGLDAVFEVSVSCHSDMEV